MQKHSRNAEHKVASFPYCGFKERITGNYKSFIGRDFKAFMQMGLLNIY